MWYSLKRNYVIMFRYIVLLLVNDNNDYYYINLNM